MAYNRNFVSMPLSLCYDKNTDKFSITIYFPQNVYWTQSCGMSNVIKVEFYGQIKTLVMLCKIQTGPLI